MSERGGIYTAPNGQQLYGDGKVVAAPCSELAAPSGYARCNRCGDDDPQNIRSDGLCGTCYEEVQEDAYLKHAYGIYRGVVA